MLFKKDKKLKTIKALVENRLIYEETVKSLGLDDEEKKIFRRARMGFKNGNENQEIIDSAYAILIAKSHSNTDTKEEENFVLENKNESEESVDKGLENNSKDIQLENIPNSKQYFCTKCGSPLKENAKFCTKCGASISGVVGSLNSNNGTYNKVMYNSTRKIKNPWISAALSLLIPGLGQLYNGDNKKSIVMFIEVIILYLVVLYTSSASSTSPISFARVVLILYIAAYIYMVYDAWIVAKGKKRIALNWWEANKPWSYN